jgi:hypothetical protein
MMKAIASGFAGAAALNVISESARQFVPDAPRLDLEGEEFVADRLRDLGVSPPTGKALYGSALAFDVMLNGLYYAAAGMGDPEGAPMRGAMLGLAGGIANVVVSPMLGLNQNNLRRTPAMTAMTIAWYTAGGLAAGAMYRLLNRR